MLAIDTLRSMVPGCLFLCWRGHQRRQAYHAAHGGPTAMIKVARL